MQRDKLAGQLDNLRARINELNSQKDRLPTGGDGVSLIQVQNLIEEVFFEVTSALENLQVAEEEIRQQNEELASAGQMLQAERQRYQDLFEFAPDGYLVTDPGGIIKEANHVAAFMLNVNEEYLIGKPLAVFIAKQDRPSFRSRLGQLGRLAMKDGEGVYQEWEFRILPRHKDPIDASLTLLAIQRQDWQSYIPGMNIENDNDQLSITLRWILRNVTRRKHAERELRESENRLRTVVSGAPVILWAVDQRERITFLLGRELERIPYVPKEATGLSLFEIIEDTTELRNCLRRAFSGEEVVGETTTIGLPGEVYETHFSPYFDSSGALQGVIGVSTNITSRKLAGDMLRENASRAAILGDFSRSIVKAGPDFQEILTIAARTAASLIGDHCHIQLVSEDGGSFKPAAFHHIDPASQEILQGALQGNLMRIEEGVSGVALATDSLVLVTDSSPARLRKRIKQEYSVYLDRYPVSNLACLPLRMHGKSIGTITLGRNRPIDIYTEDERILLQTLTDQVALAIANASLYAHLEEALKDEQTLRAQLIQVEKHTALSRMVASVAHELNNPIQTIQNCLFLTQEDTPPGSVTEEYLSMALSETRRVTNLVSQLREMYRPNKAGNMQSLDLGSLLSEVKALLAAHLDQKNVTWQQPDQTLDVQVGGIVDQIKQVFLNICLNAIEAMQPDGGVLRVGVCYRETPRFVGIAFQDSGPGIRAEDMSKVFEPFFTTKEGGTGLGLSICYDIMQRHGGRIDVESQPGNGTTFTVWLPVLEEGDGGHA